MKIIKKFRKSMDLYDSDTGKTVFAYKAIDITEHVMGERLLVVKYANVVRGKIAQLCMWYKGSKGSGSFVHYFLNEMTIESLARDSVFEMHIRMMKANPIDIAKIIFDNQ